MRIAIIACLTFFVGAGGTAQVSLSWLRTFAGPSGEDIVTQIALVSNDSVVVAGPSRARTRSGLGQTAFVKYARDGSTEWVQRFASQTDVADVFVDHCMPQDSRGSFVLAGQTLTDRGELETLVIKRSSEGSALWDVQHLYPGALFSFATGVTVDAQDNIWVVGSALFDDGQRDFNQLQLLKFNPDGELVWERLYDGPSGRASTPASIALDRSGNAYVACSTPGRAVPGITSNSDFLLIKYSPSGERVWERRFDGPVEGSDFPRCIAYDPRGFILMGGNVDINPAPEEQSYVLAMLRYTLDGELAGVWMNIPDDQLYHLHSDYFRKLAIAPDGSIGGAAVHMYNGAKFVKDVTVVRFDPEFNFQWLYAYNTIHDEAGAADVLFDSEGNVYACGSAHNHYLATPEPTYLDALVMKLSPEGNLLWSFRWNNPVGNMVDTAYALALDSRNNVVAGGWTQPFPNAVPRFLTFKLCQIQGDADRNGTVDGADIELVIERFGLPGDPESASGDLNGDGIVDDADLALVLTDFGKVCQN